MRLSRPHHALAVTPSKIFHTPDTPPIGEARVEARKQEGRQIQARRSELQIGTVVTLTHYGPLYRKV